MLDDRHLLQRLPVTVRFDLAIRHCPKCGWTGAAAEAALRYCGPGQRVEGDWSEMLPFGEAGPPPCRGEGEHFHWQCPACRYRRVLPMPHQDRPGVN